MQKKVFQRMLKILLLTLWVLFDCFKANLSVVCKQCLWVYVYVYDSTAKASLKHLNQSFSGWIAGVGSWYPDIWLSQCYGALTHSCTGATDKPRQLPFVVREATTAEKVALRTKSAKISIYFASSSLPVSLLNSLWLCSGSLPEKFEISLPRFYSGPTLLMQCTERSKYFFLDFWSSELPSLCSQGSWRSMLL